MAKEIGPIAKPKRILVVPELPKTRSGKIIRRNIAENREVGDVSTLQDSNVLGLITSGLSGRPRTESSQTQEARGAPAVAGRRSHRGLDPPDPSAGARVPVGPLDE